MEEYKTNQHYNYFNGLSVEYYNDNIENARESNDVILITAGRLFRGIMSSEDPYKAALDFANFIIENGENLLPSIITFYVDKFNTLPVSIQEKVIQNTVVTNNYFRSDSGSDKIAIFANSEEYRTRSSSVASYSDQSPESSASENIKNKISPLAYLETVALSKLTETIIQKSHADIMSIETYNIISNSTHNNCRTITPTTNHLEAAQQAKSEIEANSYKAFDDCYRVKREYTFRSNPYNIEHRQDNVSNIIIDKNTDIVGDKKLAVYSTAGNIPLKSSIVPQDLYSIMPPSREESNRLTKTELEERSPISGEAGTNTNKLNKTAGRLREVTYKKEKLKK